MSLQEQHVYELTRKNQQSEIRRQVKTVQGLKINWRDYGGSTVLHIACAYGFTDLTRLYLAHPGVAVNQRDIYGCTPFFLACSNGRTAVVGILLRDSRVHVDEPDDNGCSPLWWACFKGHVDIVRQILASGREINWSRKGKYYTEYSLLDAAQQSGSKPLVAMVKAVTADVAEARRDARTQLKIIGEPRHFHQFQTRKDDHPPTTHHPPPTHAHDDVISVDDVIKVMMSLIMRSCPFGVIGRGGFS